MTEIPHVTRDANAGHIGFHCQCGWDGTDSDIVEWDVQRELDRAVRTCPECSAAVPEWGALTGLDGLEQVAYGPLQDAFSGER